MDAWAGREHLATAKDWFLFSSVIPGEANRTIFIYLLITELGSVRDGCTHHTVLITALSLLWWYKTKAKYGVQLPVTITVTTVTTQFCLTRSTALLYISIPHNDHDQTSHSWSKQNS